MLTLRLASLPQFSGHHGTWVPNDSEAQVFDKKYYEELFRRAWRPRDVGTDHQDWTTGSSGSRSPKMMLNTDSAYKRCILFAFLFLARSFYFVTNPCLQIVCLLFDIDDKKQCCSRTNLFKSNGRNRCEVSSLENKECSRINRNHPRFEASKAVKTFLGGSGPNDNNAPFYDAFAVAWFKATTNGLDVLKPLKDTC